MNIDQFAGNQFSSMDEQPVSRDGQRNVNSRGSNRILEPLFPPAGKSQQNFNSNNMESNKSINFYNNIAQPKLDMIHEDSDMI